MTDDKALLEAAARAAGIDLTDARWHEDMGAFVFMTPRTPNWNPLRNDADAIRLALKLRLSIIHSSEYIQGEEIPTVEVIGPERPNGSRHCEMHSLDDDPAATVRRCIVMAAAASLGQEAKHG